MAIAVEVFGFNEVGNVEQSGSFMVNCGNRGAKMIGNNGFKVFDIA